MDSVLDLSVSRKARADRCERLKSAANDLLVLLDEHRPHISQEFMTFLVAMLACDQALHYANQADNKQAGLEFLDNMELSARQIYETRFHSGAHASAVSAPPRTGQIVDFFTASAHSTDL